MPLAPQFHSQWHLDAHQFGLLVGVYAYAAGVVGFSSAWFIDRVDRRISLLVVYVLFTLGNYLCAQATTYEFLLFARCLTGASGGLLGGIIMAIVGDIIPYSRRGLATGIVMSSFSVASIVGIPWGLILAEKYSWRYTFYLLSILSWGLAALAWFLLPSVKSHLHHRQPESPWKTTWLILRNIQNVKAFLLMASLIMTTFMLVPYMPSYLVGNVGMDTKDIKWIYLVGGLVTLITMPAIGKLADRYGKLRVFQVLAAITIFPVLLVSHLPPSPLHVILLSTTFMMIFTAGRSVPAMALVTAVTTPERRGGFMSLLGAIQQLSIGLATTLGGLILGIQASSNTPAGSAESIKPLVGYHLVGWVAAFISLLSVYLGSRLAHVDTHASQKAVVESPLPTEVT